MPAASEYSGKLSLLILFSFGLGWQSQGIRDSEKVSLSILCEYNGFEKNHLVIWIKLTQPHILQLILLVQLSKAS